ncbi:probable fatty acid-binding protein [Pararge aegeria]|uniref:Jg17946 protein n=1 Tax=Pararge aegeria aegeria TaxID=348720 RepID=A0A8S4RG01_9NEOP|nr:probable fatty acid-binding protein [Pararge aegeria]CAH2234669.1 jg17946 [Pararge aegeria aegeria]
MEEFLGKQYVMVSQENFDDYLVFMGVGYISRKAAISLRPTHCLTRNDDGTYTFALKSKLANSSCTFTPGEKFQETKADGVKVEALITFEGNIMTHKQIETNERTSTHIREFHPDKLSVTTTAVGFEKTVTRVFQLVQ